VYGGGKDALSLTLDPSALSKALDPALKRNTLLELKIEDRPADSCHVMIKDVQNDTVKDVVIHVDLIRIAEGEMVECKVPLVLTGRAEGVKLGGVIKQVFRDLPLRAPAGRIPKLIEIDVTPWNVGQGARAGDLNLGDGIQVLLDAKQTVAAVVVQKAVMEEKPAEAAEAAPGEGDKKGEGDKAEGGDRKKAEGDKK
jgi:large subunit ribosomal protein L25